MTSIALWAACGLAACGAADEAPKLDAALAKQVGAAFDKTIAYYRRSQAADGSFAAGDQFNLGITGLATTGLARSQRVPLGDPLLANAVGYLKTFVQPDGGICLPKGGQQNYFTAISTMAFAATNREGRHDAILANAAKFLKANQFSEEHPGKLRVDKKDPRYGGVGYGGSGRPDLSNTAMAVEALAAAGTPKDDPALQRALVFLRRCQNYRGEGGNDLALGADADMDGGFVYAPNETRMPAEKSKSPAGGLRSYASMTYAGLKSFLHAGLTPDDPRAKAALTWISEHYSVEENPGLGQAGLYYYYHTFAKALALAKADVKDAAGAPRNWRADLCRKLVAAQRPDGSWANADKRWLEDNAKLATGFALLALAEALR